MNKPITIYIPDYYNQKNIDDNCLKLSKTKPLSKKDDANAMLIVSIEKIENYKCRLQCISEKDRETITNNFKSAKLSLKIADCETYALNWHHFIVRWLDISKDYVLQLMMVVTKPQYLAYHTTHFSSVFYKTEVNKNYDYSNISDIGKVFKIKLLKEVQKENEITLKITGSQFLKTLKKELEEKEEVQIESFMCTDWNMYYNLYNPENFSNPDSTIEWEDNSDVFDYYEKPFTDNSKITIVCNEKVFGLDTLKNLVSNTGTAEQKLLSFFEHYTFGNGGAYADTVHYQWAKIEIERLHKTTYSNQEFLKRNLCLEDIIITENADKLKLYFKCSWDTEHGIDIILDKNFECKAEE